MYESAPQDTVPEMPAEEVDDYFHYFIEKGHKRIRATCIHCGLSRIKSIPRQRQHLLECPGALPSEPEPTAAASVNTSSTQSVDDASSLFTSRGISLRFDTQLVSNPNTREDRGVGMEASSHGAPVHYSQTPVPSGGNHPLSTFLQSPGFDISSVSSPAPSSQNGPIVSQQYGWMSNHNSVPAEVFLQHSRSAKSVKIEPGIGQKGMFSSLESARIHQASNNDAPMASIEIVAEEDDDDDDSAMSISSESEDDESRSDSDADSDADSDEASGEDDGSEYVPCFCPKSTLTMIGRMRDLCQSTKENTNSPSTTMRRLTMIPIRLATWQQMA
jgi:hypothetical protein